ncbi:hypothetical protein CORMATOL_03035 [Corynebacterium matruchotii ATCC 33806]|uniref:Uncharacterized protein n=1 Tax=Corynebacterium matruchotii ATCC 33806 TaxID=566549 RepID=C0E7P5_9CORY|nr:hypothetical protein CORMATOL_03035 [Corynebacterium matruchotii ATCC 33806]
MTTPKSVVKISFGGNDVMCHVLLCKCSLYLTHMSVFLLA